VTDGPARTISGVERALDVLQLFGNEGVTDLGVTQIADQLGISKAVVHRILSSFLVKGFVAVDSHTRRYRLGPQVLRLGLTYLDRLDVSVLARSALRDLSELTDETATLSVQADARRVYVDQVTPARDIKMVVTLGGAYPLHAGASSKALLSYLPDHERDGYLDTQPLTAVTENTITDRAVLEQQIIEIRARGYAISFGERQPGSGSVAAPILGREAEPVAVISVCGPAERFASEVDGCARALLDTTERLSKALGYRPA
jgi:DNA-binding IclR family transcriptional regulator